MSAPDSERHDLTGERRKIIKATCEKARKLGDNKVWFLDGKTLMGRKNRDFCFVDSCHPNDLGFYRMAKAIYKAMCQIDEIYR